MKTKISLLIVEDDPGKLALIQSKFSALDTESLDFSITIETAESCFSAIEKYDRCFFDAIILDLKIPLGTGSNHSLSIENAREFYDHVLLREESLPSLIVGLTSLPETEYRDVFRAHSILNIEAFSVTDDTWFDNILKRIKFVTGSKRSVSKLHSRNYDLDLVVLVAREKNEFIPIRNEIHWVGEPSVNEELDRKNVFGKASLPSGQVITIGLVSMGEMGLSVSAALTSQLIYMFRPRYFAMLGMCCGFKKDSKGQNLTKLGDVIIASSTANWDEGMYQADLSASKKDPFFQNETKVRMPPMDFGMEIEQSLEGEWEEYARILENHYLQEDVRAQTKLVESFNPKSNLHYKMLLSGSSVINSVLKVDEIRLRYSNAFGLEMEGHSIYCAANCIGGVKPKTVVIKGVADHGDGNKTKSIQPAASIASLRVLELLIQGIESAPD